MKIRHKQSGVELEGVCECGAYFLDGGPVIGAGSLYSRHQWEAVPEWVEASVDVEVSAGGEAMMGDGRVISRCSVGYRFRKVRVSIDGLPKWAFIVEHKT